VHQRLTRAVLGIALLFGFYGLLGCAQSFSPLVSPNAATSPGSTTAADTKIKAPSEDNVPGPTDTSADAGTATPAQGLDNLNPMSRNLSVTDPGDGAAEQQKILTSKLTPIDPKNDSTTVQIIMFLDARLRYGVDYSVILPKRPSMPMLVPSHDQNSDLQFGLDYEMPGGTEGKNQTWVPALGTEIQRNGAPSQIRLIFVPAGKSDEEALYCDATWQVNEGGGVLVTFPNVRIGPGKLSFYLHADIHRDSAGLLVNDVTSDFHTGDLIPLETGTPFKPFPGEKGATIPLGSFQAFRLMPLLF